MSSVTYLEHMMQLNRMTIETSQTINLKITKMKNPSCYPALYSNFTPHGLIRLAESLFNENRANTVNWVPSADVSETENAYVVKMDIPSVKAEEVKVTVLEGVLTIQGERASEKSTDKETVHLQERSYGSFSRSFSLPKNADADQVAADFQHGTLTVTIPKRAEAKSKEITVRVA